MSTRPSFQHCMAALQAVLLVLGIDQEHVASGFAPVVVIDDSNPSTFAAPLRCPPDLSGAAGLSDDGAGLGVLGKCLLQESIIFIAEEFLKAPGESYRLYELHAAG